MRYKCLPQEALKLIACVSMLLSHIGSAVYPSRALVIIGRLAFPIFCFLLVEGIRRTGNSQKYVLRLGMGILLSELPYDYLRYGTFSWEGQSVMVTLCLGAIMLLCMDATRKHPGKLLILVCFALAAEFTRCDYGGWGIGIIGLFALTDSVWQQIPALLLLNFWCGGGRLLSYRGLPIQVFAAAALLPISMYNGKKLSYAKPVQWLFYLFYPAHLAALCLIRKYIG